MSQFQDRDIRIPVRTVRSALVVRGLRSTHSEKSQHQRQKKQQRQHLQQSTTPDIADKSRHQRQEPSSATRADIDISDKSRHQRQEPTSATRAGISGKRIFRPSLLQLAFWGLLSFFSRPLIRGGYKSQKKNPKISKKTTQTAAVPGTAAKWVNNWPKISYYTLV
jgi:hypothetical protein